MFDIREKYSAIAQGILKESYGVDIAVHFDIPSEEGHGDLTTSIALRAAKEAKKQPREIAQSIKAELEKAEGVASCEIAGPGYVNVTLSSSILLSALTEIDDAIAPQKTRKKEAPVIVEYSDPNMAKPLGIHHILATSIGQAITNIHRHLGYNTIAINHIGDWGTQFGQLYVAHKKWSDTAIEKCSLDQLLELYVRFHAEAEKNETLVTEARDAFAKLEKGDKELRTFLEEVVRITMEENNAVYERLHVQHDHVQGESFYQDTIAPVLEEGKKKNVFVPGKEGALIVEFSEESKIPPAIVVKGDGSSIYLTRDLATVRYRIDTWHPQAVLYVVDVAQQLYFTQIFATVEKLGWDADGFEHVIFGRMRFPDKSMSTRKGNIVKLMDVLDEAVTRADALIKEKSSEIKGKEREELKEMLGIGAVVYGVLSQNRKMDIVFDWDKALSFEGNSAPYLQYTHARARSVIRKAEAENISMKPLKTYDGTIEPSERAIVRMLASFSDVLKSARSDRMPHKLGNYLYQLCQTYNTFYNAAPILKADGDTRVFRLLLTDAVSRVLKTGAELLTLRVPERM